MLPKSLELCSQLFAEIVHCIQGMEGTTLGIWCAHGEGRVHFPDQDIRQAVESQSLAPIR